MLTIEPKVPSIVLQASPTQKMRLVLFPALVGPPGPGGGGSGTFAGLTDAPRDNVLLDAELDAVQSAAEATAAADATTKADAAQAFAIQRANHTGTQLQSTVTGLVADLALKADLVGGVIPTAQIPAIAITEFLGSVANQAAMLALVGQKGDWAIRTDLAMTAVITGNDPTQIADWTLIAYPAAPVSSVNGQTGTVVLAKADVGLGNADNTSDANKPVSTAQAAADGVVLASAAADATTKANNAQSAAAADATTKANNAQAAAIAASIPISYLDTDTGLAANSDAKVASQKATKAYVDSLLAASDAVVFRGVIDCSADPNYPAADAGHLYIVSVAGKIGGATFGRLVEAGDMLICKTDGRPSESGLSGNAHWAVIQTNLNAFTTVGIALTTLANPGAITFMRINADNSVTTRTAVQMLTDLGGTTVGTGLFTQANPGAIRFNRLNADNSVSQRTAAELLADIGAQAANATLASIAAAATPEAMRDVFKIGPRWCTELIADFSGGNLNSTSQGVEWDRTASGTGATFTGGAPITGYPSTGRGLFQLGTTATGRVAFGTNSSALRLGLGVETFHVKQQLLVLSDATDNWTERLGLTSTDNGEPVRGCYFRYNHAVNGGRWEAVTRNAGVETVSDTGITAVAGVERNFRIVVNAAGTSVAFYIDNMTTPVATHTTNIPGGSLALGHYVWFNRSAGTAAVTAASIDLLYIRSDYTTARW